MLVFHTSDQQFFTPDVIHSRDALDFGKGFYVTRLREQAVGYADRFLKAGIDAVLHIYEFTLDTNLRIKVFDSYNEEWLNFVCNCRKGSNVYKQYDIIDGGVANDKIYRTVDLYITGVYNKKQALDKLMYEKPNHQLCFTTQKAIDKCLKLIEHKVIKHG